MKKIIYTSYDKKTLLLPLIQTNKNFQKKILNQSNLSKLKNFLKKNFKTYKPPIKEKEVSREI